MKKVNLMWVDKIRSRLKEYKNRPNYKEFLEFIEPILEYGEAEENDITEKLNSPVNISEYI